MIKLKMNGRHAFNNTVEIVLFLQYGYLRLLRLVIILDV